MVLKRRSAPTGVARKPLDVHKAGGISGAPPARSLHRSNPLYLETNSGSVAHYVGGIFTAEDAWEKITAGASLVQVYTGWIYEGPLMVSHFRGLLQKLEEQDWHPSLRL